MKRSLVYLLSLFLTGASYAYDVERVIKHNGFIIRESTQIIKEKSSGIPSLGKKLEVHSDVEVKIKKPNDACELAIVPDFPRSSYPQARIKKISINGKNIPLDLVQRVEYDTILEERISIFELMQKGILNEEEIFGKDAVLKITYDCEVTFTKFDSENILEEYEGLEEMLSSWYGIWRLPVDDPYIKDICKKLKHENPLVAAKNCYDYVIEIMEYSGKELHLDVIEAMKKGIGDCDDYARIFVTLLRCCGIPAKVETGNVGKFRKESHAWARFCVPMKDRKQVWLTSDPTFGEKYGRKTFICNQHDNKSLKLIPRYMNSEVKEKQNWK